MFAGSHKEQEVMRALRAYASEVVGGSNGKARTQVAGRERRRPLVPLPNRPNPTDPGDAADLSIPAGLVRGYSQASNRAARRAGASGKEAARAVRVGRRELKSFNNMEVAIFA